VNYLKFKIVCFIDNSLLVQSFKLIVCKKFLLPRAYSATSPSRIKFLTSVELQINNNVCACVCPKPLEQPREVKNGLIMLKFDTLACGLDEYLGMYFSFFENLPLWALGTRFSLNFGAA